MSELHENQIKLLDMARAEDFRERIDALDRAEFEDLMIDLEITLGGLRILSKAFGVSQVKRSYAKGSL